MLRTIAPPPTYLTDMACIKEWQSRCVACCADHLARAPATPPRLLDMFRCPRGYDNHRYAAGTHPCYPSTSDSDLEGIDDAD